MLIPHIDFPVRPPIEKGESLAGYIFRFYSTNGHRVPYALHGALCRLYGGSHKKAETAFDIVQSIVGDSVVLNHSWWLNGLLIDRHYKRCQRIVWRRLNFDPVRFCPICLSEFSFHLALWELPIMQACLLHKCVLLTKCTLCQKYLSWPVISPDWSCRCGKSIATMSAKPASKSALVVAQFLAESSDDIEQPDNIQENIRELLNGGCFQSDIRLSLDQVEFQDIIFEERGKFWDYPKFGKNYLMYDFCTKRHSMVSGNEP